MKVPEPENTTTIELLNGVTVHTYNNINEGDILTKDGMRVIHFYSPIELEYLIEALIYARLMMTHGPYPLRDDLLVELSKEAEISAKGTVKSIKGLPDEVARVTSAMEKFVAALERSGAKKSEEF